MADKLMRTMIVMSFFLGMALFSSCGKSETSLAEADNGKQIIVNTGDVIALTLESNPATGYSWYVTEIDNTVLIQIGETEYKSSGRNIPGAGGTETFRFEAAGSGKTTLELSYLRPWEDVPPIESFAIQIIVQ